MILSLAAAALVALAEPPPSPPSSPPGSEAAAEAPRTPRQEAQDNYERAQKLFDDSCKERAYAAYDDLCEQLSKQIHAYRVELDKQEREEEDRAARAAPPKR